MDYSFIFYIIIILFVGIIIYFNFGRFIKQIINRKRLYRDGQLSLAEVVSISQTGTTINQVPEMRLVLDIANAGGVPRRVENKQLVDLGNMPRAGDQVYVLVDPQNPSNVLLTPSPSGKGMPLTIIDGNNQPTAQLDLSDPVAKDFVSLPAVLRERGAIGIAKVVSVEPTGNRQTRITLNLDRIGQPNQQVTITQRLTGFMPVAGSRLYYIYDPEQPDHIVITPNYLNHQGRVLAAATNRLDAFVLGPQLLHEGAKASGKVLTVNP